MKRLPAVVALTVVAACTSSSPTPTGWTPPSGPRSTSEFLLDFEETLIAEGGGLPQVTNAGTGDARTGVATLAGGRVTLTEVGSGYGVRLPGFQDSARPPAAVLVVRANDVDLFSPGSRPFRFGVDFSLDEVSAGDGTDNGDNLVQRGWFADEAQYKLQLDRGVPSCRVSGRDGVGLVRAATTVSREHWYRVTCERRGSQLTLSVVDLEAPTATEFHATAATGEVLPEGDVPLSVGGKVHRNGSIVASSTDQFNGSVDNVFYELIG